VEIGPWLESLGLGRYAQAFRDNDIDAALLPTLTADDLRELGVASLGHRKRLLAAIGALTKPPEARPAAPAPGAALPVSPAERRQLTVMFADLVGSTALSTRLDPEEVGEVLRAYRDAVAAAVARFEGHVAKYMGDGVLAYFGWPSAHEDEAERAVRAALAAVEAVGRLGTPGGARLACRVGLATGLVVVGEPVGEGAAREEAVVGETPNLAARLQGLAASGTVVLGEATRRLLGGLFELEELPAPALKGFDGPQRAFRVLGEGAARDRFEALRGTGGAPLVGREHELGLLLDRWERARDGEGQVVLLSGEPGIGKSRLLRALRERLAGEPHAALGQYCSPFHRTGTLHPVVGLLERVVRFDRGDPPSRKLDKLEAMLTPATADAAEAVPLVAALLSIPTGDRYPPPALAPQRQKERTLEVLLDQLAGLAAARPVLDVFEDVHWADPTTLELLDLLVDRVRALPVLVLVTSRPGFAPRWTGRAHVTPLALGRLSRRQGAAVVGHLTGGKALPAEVLERIVERTDGVPLFVEELTKAVLEAGLLREEDEGYTLAGPLPPPAIPATLHDSLMARLDRLATPAREVAQVGAVIGREFGHGLLAAVAGVADGTLGDALERLVGAGLLFRRGVPPDATYAFKHALVQDAAYESLLKSRRQHWHARVARAVEEGHPGATAADPGLLAHHFARAGLTEKAAEYHEKAGRRALAASAAAEALAHFGQALEQLGALPASEGRLRRELAIRLAQGSGAIAAHGFTVPAVGEAYGRAAELCEELGEERELFPVLYGLGLHRLYRGELAAVTRGAERLLALAEGADDRGLLFFAHRAIAVAAWPAGDFARARCHVERALGLYAPEAHRTPASVYAFDPRVVCLDHLARALLPLGFPERALAVNDEAAAEARRVGHANSLALPLFYGGVMRQILGDREGVRARVDELARTAAEVGLGFWQIGAAILHGWLLADAGDPAAGLAAIRRGVEEWRAAGAEYLLPYFLALAAQAELAAARPRAALDLLAEARGRVERTGEGWYAAEILRLEGEALLALGGDHAADAEGRFARACAEAARGGARLWELRAATGLARLLARRGERGEARGLLAPVHGWFGEGSGMPDLVGAARLLEELA
jgi:class 3 adenylate cyclase/predicted ATPase